MRFCFQWAQTDIFQGVFDTPCSLFAQRRTIAELSSQSARTTGQKPPNSFNSLAADATRGNTLKRVQIPEARGCPVVKPLGSGRNLKTKAIPLHILAVVKGSGKLRPIRISAVGFCFGGLGALDLARTGPDVRAIASFIVS